VREPAILLAAACLAGATVLALAAAAAPRLLGAARVGVVGAQTALALHAAVDVLEQAGGHRPPEPFTHGGYLVVSVLLLPLLVGRGSSLTLDLGPAPSRSDLLVVALGSLVSIVVLARLNATWD
jgi:hypothetical protein